MYQPTWTAVCFVCTISSSSKAICRFLAFLKRSTVHWTLRAYITLKAFIMLPTYRYVLRMWHKFVAHMWEAHIRKLVLVVMFKHAGIKAHFESPSEGIRIESTSFKSANAGTVPTCFKQGKGKKKERECFQLWMGSGSCHKFIHYAITMCRGTFM